jgi:hypothetical protein
MFFRKSVFSLALLSVMPIMLTAGNLLFNSSFELGEGGWSAFSLARKTSNGEFIDVAHRWEIDGKDAYIGKNSFLMWNEGSASARTVISSHDFLVSPDKSYTVSFWAKASKAGIPLGCSTYSSQRLVRRDDGGHPLPDIDFNNCSKDAMSYRNENGTVNLSTEWKRHSYSFSPEKGFTAYALWFDISIADCSVHLDGIQVEEGLLTDYAPKADTEAAVVMSDYLYEDSSSVKGTVKDISYTQDRSLTLPITLYDTFFERKMQEKTLNFALKKGIVSEEGIAFDHIPYGMFCVYTGLQPRTTQPGFYAKWDEQPECLNYERLRYGDESYQSAAYFTSVCKNLPYTKTGFRMGTTGPLDGTLHVGGTTLLGSSDEIVRIIRLSGSNVLRCWDPTICQWSSISPEKGVFVWDGNDQRIKVAEKAGVKLMCVIGGDFLNRPPKYRRNPVPEWAQKRDRSGNPEGTPVSKDTWHGKLGYVYLQPQLEDWREYVSAVVTRYKGRIVYYELLNEASLYLPAKCYMEYMKVAAEEIRKADPDAVILGISSTSDRKADINTYIGKCLALGADSYMDHITIHPYAVLDNSYPVSQPEERRALLGDLKKLNVKAGVWNGENYFVIPSWNPMTNYSHRWEPENLARHLIMDMGEGLVGSTPTHYGSSLLSTQLHPFMNGDAYRNAHLRVYPNAIFAVHSATARFIAGATPVQKYDLPTGAFAYTFSNHGKLYSSVWNARIQQKATMTITPPGGSSVTIYDVMGNIIEKTEKTVTLPLSAKPYYLEWNKTTAEAVDEAFKNSSIKCEQPLVIKNAVILNDNGKSTLFATLENMSGKPISNTAIPMRAEAFQELVNINVKDLDSKPQTFNIPVKLKTGTVADIKVVAEFLGGKYSCNAAVKELAAKVSAEPMEFKIEKCVSGKTTGTKDISASFKISLRQKNTLHLDITVRDDVKGKDASVPYEQDCIELFLDETPFAVEGSIKQVMIPWKAGTFSRLGVKGEVKDTADGYEASLDIPVGGLEFLGFDIAIDDSDDANRKSQTVWHGNAKNYEDRTALGIIRL